MKRLYIYVWRERERGKAESSNYTLLETDMKELKAMCVYSQDEYGVTVDFNKSTRPTYTVPMNLETRKILFFIPPFFIFFTPFSSLVNFMPFLSDFTSIIRKRKNFEWDKWWRKEKGILKWGHLYGMVHWYAVHFLDPTGSWPFSFKSSSNYPLSSLKATYVFCLNLISFFFFNFEATVSSFHTPPTLLLQFFLSFSLSFFQDFTFL